MDEQQLAARQFIDDLCEATGWSKTRLARGGGMTHTTLTRFQNDDNVTHTLSARTLAKLKRSVRDKISAEKFDMLWLIAQQPRRQA